MFGNLRSCSTRTRNLQARYSDACSVQDATVDGVRSRTICSTVQFFTVTRNHYCSVKVEQDSGTHSDVITFGFSIRTIVPLFSSVSTKFSANSFSNAYGKGEARMFVYYYKYTNSWTDDGRLSVRNT